MKRATFDEFVNGQLSQVKTLLAQKGREYTLSGDALATYRKASDYLGNVPAQALILSRIVEKLERLRSQSELNQPLSKDALHDLIGHTLFILAFEYEKNVLDTSETMWDNTGVG